MIELRDLREDDGEQLFRWRREPEVDRWMCGLPPETLEGHSRWFRALRGDPDRRGWIITRNKADAGLLTLTGLATGQRRAEWGWYIGEPEARGRGAGRAAQALGLDLAFEELGLDKVSAEVLAENDTALRSQAAAGFRREGYLRAHVLKAGVRRDVVLLGILADEWRANRAAIRRDLTGSLLIAA